MTHSLSLYSTPSSSPEEPIVCTADLKDKVTMQAQLDGYRAAFSHLRRTERFSNAVRWVFTRHPGLDVELRRLAENEHQCCKFFKFDLRESDGEVIWEITAEAGASAVLEEFALLPERLRQHERGPDVAAIKQTVGAAGLVFAADQPNSQ
ncbi:MAG: hypothetical protein ACOY0T_02565 [Myxococcota bacterium]